MSERGAAHPQMVIGASRCKTIPSAKMRGMRIDGGGVGRGAGCPRAMADPARIRAAAGMQVGPMRMSPIAAGCGPEVGVGVLTAKVVIIESCHRVILSIFAEWVKGVGEDVVARPVAFAPLSLRFHALTYRRYD